MSVNEKGEFMEELKQIHNAINQLWTIIKTHHQNTDTDEGCASMLEAFEALNFDDDNINDMVGDWIVAYTKYLDRRTK